MMPPNMNSSLPTVGLIGLGAMGGGMAASLRRAGFTPHVFDVRAEVAQAFAAGQWTMVEVVDARVRSGHVYLEVSERTAQGEVVAVVPWQCLSWHAVTLPPHSGPRLSAVLQGLLEEQLLDDPAQLHLAVAPHAPTRSGGATLVALPMTTDPVQALLQRTWVPTLSVTGAEGFPALKDAGNVLRPYTAFKLSLRLPPLVDAAQAVQHLKTLLEDNAPYQAKVTFEAEGSANGWNAPSATAWFEQALNQASQAHFGAPVGYIGQGGTIPLMSMLSQGFPRAQMMVCGVLGPKSNAHGPNEFLHVPYAKRLTAAVAQVIAQMPGGLSLHAERRPL